MFLEIKTDQKLSELNIKFQGGTDDTVMTSTITEASDTSSSDTVTGKKGNANADKIYDKLANAAVGEAENLEEEEVVDVENRDIKVDEKFASEQF